MVVEAKKKKKVSDLIIKTVSKELIDDYLKAVSTRSCEMLINCDHYGEFK